MRTDYQLSNLLGTVYTRGNLLFAPDGASLLSPVGNRVISFDIANHSSKALPVAHSNNISRLALSPAGNLLLSVDDAGHLILSNVPRRVVLYHFSLKQRANDLKFSPCGRYFAAALGNLLQVWRTPDSPGLANASLEFAPFVKHRDYTGHNDTINSVQWSSDSRFLLTASKDMTARIWSLNPESGFVPTILSGHRQGVKEAWFSKDQEKIYTASTDGALFRWIFGKRPNDMSDDEDNEQWIIEQKHFFLQERASLTCAAFHKETNLLVAGFSNGVFCLCELPDFNIIHTLSISQHNIDCVTFNKGGEWLAFGATATGQLLVWEWQSESYLLKQEGHFDSINDITYTPDGTRIITAADDGKVKIWDAQSGFAVATFTEHTSGVTATAFSKRGNILFTSSLDGSIRVWDLLRYRNFRTFTAPTRLSFSSLAIDPSGEVVCAGSLDSFDIYAWSVQTGQLLEQLSAHEGPVSTLNFTPNGSSLISGSWDHTIRVWSIFARAQTSEPFQLQSDILASTISPDSSELAVSTLDGQVSFWNIADGVQRGGLDGKRDISGGRKASDRRTAAAGGNTKHFNTLAYTPDGSCLLAAGNSNFICLYDVANCVLLKKFTVSINRNLDATAAFLNSRNITDAGPQDLLDMNGDNSDLEDRLYTPLPGTKAGKDVGRRSTRPEIRVPSIGFSPTARSFCAASTEGLLIYSLDAQPVFDPVDLDVEITPEATLACLEKGEHLQAFIMAFRLNSSSLLKRIYLAVPPESAAIALILSALPVVYLKRMLRLICEMLENTPHLEFGLIWSQNILEKQGRIMKDHRADYAPELRLLARLLRHIGRDIQGLAEKNDFMIDFLLGGKRPTSHKLSNGDNVVMDSSRQADAVASLLEENGDRTLQNGHVSLDEDDTMTDEEWHGF